LRVADGAFCGLWWVILCTWCIEANLGVLTFDKFLLNLQNMEYMWGLIQVYCIGPLPLDVRRTITEFMKRAELLKPYDTDHDDFFRGSCITTSNSAGHLKCVHTESIYEKNFICLYAITPLPFRKGGNKHTIEYFRCRLHRYYFISIGK
jgi:hypothetical protein